MAAKLDAHDPCGARAEAERLQTEAIAAVNAGRIPARYQEELGAAVSNLVASIECPITPPIGDDDEENGDAKSSTGKEKGKSGKHGKGKKG